MESLRAALLMITIWSDRQRAIDAGFDRHLTKPIDPDALEAMLLVGNVPYAGSAVRQWVRTLVGRSPQIDRDSDHGLPIEAAPPTINQLSLTDHLERILAGGKQLVAFLVPKQDQMYAPLSG